MHALADHAGHHACLLVVAHALLKKVGLPPASVPGKSHPPEVSTMFSQPGWCVKVYSKWSHHLLIHSSAWQHAFWQV